MPGIIIRVFIAWPCGALAVGPIVGTTTSISPISPQTQPSRIWKMPKTVSLVLRSGYAGIMVGG